MAKVMANKLVRGPLWATMMTAFIAALVAVFVLLQSGESARAVDEQRYETQITGGTAVPDGKYEFVAVLYDSSVGPPVASQFCGGALIDRDSVLTAAHCVHGYSSAPVRVTVGRTELDSNQGQTRRISRMFVHSRYNATTLANDAAVLKLSSPVTGIAPARLASASQDFLENAGRTATIAGWGNMTQQSPDYREPDTYPERMREAQVPLVSDSSAEHTYDPIYGASGFIPPIQVAAGGEGKDTCEGDSGGPMFAEVSGRFTQIGITSWGHGCGAEGYPGVYTEVNATSIRSFITNAASK